jgi:hypothetical protein
MAPIVLRLLCAILPFLFLVSIDIEHMHNRVQQYFLNDSNFSVEDCGMNVVSARGWESAVGHSHAYADLAWLRFGCWNPART